MDPRNNPFSQFDWNEFEKYFQGILPQNSDISKKTNWIEDYVRQVLKDNVPDMQSASNAKRYDTEIMETVEHLLFKIKIPDRAEAQKLKVFTANHQIKLESKDNREIQWFRLPHPVDPASCKAVYKEGALQLLLRKLGKEEPFYQATIEFP
ncbi:Hsp20/alpha crystallin family protein [Paenibacillus sp. OAS669]|uniref:Hsp20/alpha crystallin family protein n=1 Tax=Paenibacillus sp. OAS669 TaxID=2663821 RepID=UPI001789E928|nr:Hsp20/alpha crystallin family protein [Paenibacillus sp. OAS669]MBE1445466.1 HSP20 family molecular chaperone IbpA [Paenibacillus sp. OAS669]